MPCRECKAIDHSELTYPNSFSSASSKQVLLQQIMARNPDYNYAEALRKVEKCGLKGSIKPSTGEVVEERQKEEEPAVELAGQDLVETSSKPHVSSYDELFRSRRLDAPIAETEPRAQSLQTDHHGDIIANAADTAQKDRAACLNRRVQADDALARRRTTAMANSDDVRQLYMASALKHFRNRKEKRETDRASEAGGYRENEVVDPAVGDAAKRTEIEDRDEGVVQEKREGVVDGGEGLDENFPGEKGWENATTERGR